MVCLWCIYLLLCFVGNAQTLRSQPAEQGIDVYTRLQEFHKRMYSAHYMTLAIQSRGLIQFNTHYTKIK